MQNLRQAAQLLLQLDLAAFDTAHIQDIIDQAEQMIPGCHDLLKIFLHPLPVIDIVHRQ